MTFPQTIINSGKIFLGILLAGLLSFKQAVFAQTKTRTGIEVLRDDNFKILAGKRVGLVTNVTGADSEFRSTADILFEAENVNLTLLFGPEHGVRGDVAAGEHVGSSTDAKTALPVISLYGKNKKPSAKVIENLDVIVYDIQDIGCRSYTFISTMALVMEAAAEAGKEVVILDRPNPIGGRRVEGPLVEKGFYSFVSQFKIPYVYGLTCGELAVYLNEEGLLKDGKKCKLQVVKMQNWNRDMSFEDTGLEWIPTSPHIPHKNSPYFYPMSGILGELYTFSIGVGYTLPFQVFANDFADPDETADRLNALKLPGLQFRPVRFKPYYSVSKGKNIGGVQVHITDYKTAPLSEIQFRVLEVWHKMHPEKNVFELCDKSRFAMFDKVCGTDKIRKKFSQRFDFEDIRSLWYEDARKFAAKSRAYYLYE